MIFLILLLWCFALMIWGHCLIIMHEDPSEDRQSFFSSIWYNFTILTLSAIFGVFLSLETAMYLFGV